MGRRDHCGPFWMPRFMRKWMSNKFNASCKIHDMDYDSKKFNRHESDMRFLKHMIKQSKESLFWEWIAWFYYNAVRIGGKISWDKAKKDNK